MVRLDQPRERSGQVWLDISRKMKSQVLTWLWLDQCHIIKASSFGQVWLDQMPPHGSYQEWWLLIFHGSYKPKMWPATFIHEKEFHFSCVTPSSSSLVLFSPSPPPLLISKVPSTSLEVFLHILLVWIHIEKCLLWHFRDSANRGQAGLRRASHQRYILSSCRSTVDQRLNSYS